EIDLQLELAPPGCVALTGVHWVRRAVGEAKIRTNLVVREAINAAAGTVTQQISVEQVEPLNPQVCVDPLAKEKPLRERRIFVKVPRVSDGVFIHGPVPDGPVSRKSEGGRVDHRNRRAGLEALVVIVPIDAVIIRDNVRPVLHKSVTN